jgi:hypothetical protein
MIPHPPGTRPPRVQVWVTSLARLLREGGTGLRCPHKEGGGLAHAQPTTRVYTPCLAAPSSSCGSLPYLRGFGSPVFPLGIEGDETAHGPGLAGDRVRRSRVKEILHPAGIGTGDDAPTRAIPLFDEGLKRAGGIIDEVPHRPDVIGGDDGDSIEVVGYGTGIWWMGDDLPTGTVPLFDQRPAAAVSDGPDVASGDRRDCSQVGAGYSPSRWWIIRTALPLA